MVLSGTGMSVDLSVAIMHVTVSVGIMQLEVSAAYIQVTVSAANMWVTIFRKGSHLYMSLFLSVCPSVHASVPPFIHPSVRCPSINLSFHTSFHCPPVLRNRISSNHSFWYIFVKL